MQHIEVFADVVCPFTHVGLRRLREERPEGNATRFLVRAWPLEWVNGTPLAAELVGREIDVSRDGCHPTSSPNSIRRPSRTRRSRRSGSRPRLTASTTRRARR